MALLTAALQVDRTRFDGFAARLGAALQARTATAPLRAAAEAAAAEYADATQKRFNRASGGDGIWTPLAPCTVRKKARQTLFPDRILYLSGRLFASLTPGAAGSIYEVLADRVRYGTRVPYARYHQHGTPRMPARPILVPATAAVLARCTAAVTDGLRKTIADACHAA